MSKPSLTRRRNISADDQAFIQGASSAADLEKPKTPKASAGRVTQSITFEGQLLERLDRYRDRAGGLSRRSVVMAALVEYLDRHGA